VLLELGDGAQFPCPADTQVAGFALG
jgi:hypothetical protein